MRHSPSFSMPRFNRSITDRRRRSTFPSECDFLVQGEVHRLKISNDTLRSFRLRRYPFRKGSSGSSGNLSGHYQPESLAVVHLVELPKRALTGFHQNVHLSSSSLLPLAFSQVREFRLCAPPWASCEEQGFVALPYFSSLRCLDSTLQRDNTAVN